MATTTIDTGMKVRRPKFRFDKDFKKHYANDNMFMTHFANALHMIFPDGEKFFIRSIQAYADQIKDPKLQQEVKDFSGQEGVHMKMHQDFWKVMEAQGIPTKKFAKVYNDLAWGVLEPALFKFFPKAGAKRFALAVTVALEHFTAMYGEYYFKHFKENESMLPLDMHMLFAWHAAEEIEHKSVSFDVYDYVGGDYATRVGAMLFSTTLLLIAAYGGMTYFVATDKDRKPTIKEFSDFIFNFQMGLNSLGFVKEWAKFFKRDFHPSQGPGQEIAAKFFADHAWYFDKKYPEH
jgi:uncharacterized protein